jgi:hypothetical protein
MFFDVAIWAKPLKYRITLTIILAPTSNQAAKRRGFFVRVYETGQAARAKLGALCIRYCDPALQHQAQNRPSPAGLIVQRVCYFNWLSLQPRRLMPPFCVNI